MRSDANESLNRWEVRGHTVVTVKEECFDVDKEFAKQREVLAVQLHNIRVWTSEDKVLYKNESWMDVPFLWNHQLPK